MSEARTARKRKASDGRHARGRSAEDAVVAHLVAGGWTILFRNLRLGALEIDVVARREDVVAMCEVRTRGQGSFESALASIRAEKRARLRRAADALFRQHVAALDGAPRLRIDVAAVTLATGAEGVRVEYIEGAL